MAGADEDRTVREGGGCCSCNPSEKGGSEASPIIPWGIGAFGMWGFRNQRCRRGRNDNLPIYQSSARNLTLQRIGSMLPLSIAHCRRAQLDWTLPSQKARNSY